MIRELAENPNVHQPLSAGRELVTDPDGRFAIYLGTGHGAAQRHRAAGAARGRRGRARGRGDPRAPPRARPQRRRVGARRVVHACRPGRAARGARASFRTRTSRSRSGWCSQRAARWPSRRERPPAGSRRSTSSSRHGGSSTRRSAARPTRSSSSRQRPTSPPRASTAPRSSPSSTASPSRPGTPRTPRSACCSSAAPPSRPHAAAAPTGRSSPPGRTRRRRAARLSLVTHAGQMSRPILERLGFTPVARIDRLLDVSRVLARSERAPARPSPSGRSSGSRTGSSLSRCPRLRRRRRRPSARRRSSGSPRRRRRGSGSSGPTAVRSRRSERAT